MVFTKSIKIIKSGTLSEMKIEKNVKDAKKFKAKDEEFKRRFKARLAFEDYVYEMKDISESNSMLEASVKKMSSYYVKEAIEWIDTNRNAESYEYEYKKQQFEATCNKLIPGNEIEKFE